MKKSPMVYGLIGWPLGHSLSPAMHNAAFAASGIDAQYRLFPVEPQKLPAFLKDLDASGIAGLNVTVPYKEKVLDAVRLEGDEAWLKDIGAVNTMVLRDGCWYGYNTDIPGFARHLKEHTDPQDKSAVVIGAGGAARAVGYVLASEKARSVTFFDVERAKSEALVALLRRLFPAGAIRAASSPQDADIAGADILINATPVGLRPGDPSAVEPSLLHNRLFVYDLIYNPSQTSLLRLAEKAGARTSNGLGMLLYQGARSFELWTNTKAPEALMRRALESAL
jgi:shikimate dehydrogenase